LLSFGDKQENKMPPPQYLLAHPEAELSKAEKESFIKGLKAKATFK